MGVVIVQHYRNYYFNPIIGLILTQDLPLRICGLDNFNPIIGLILTILKADFYLRTYLNFNPIIGLILTHTKRYKYVYNRLFQSHYRSDFN